MDKDCGKMCIANVNGKCCAGICQGAIVRLDSGAKNMEDTAEIYEQSKEAFAYYFSDEYEADLED